MDNFKIIYKILSTLEKSMDLEQCNLDSISPEVLKISEERWNKYIEMFTGCWLYKRSKYTEVCNRRNRS